MNKFLINIKNSINKIFFKFGYRISKINNTGELVKIHKYKNYEEYKETQIHYNKLKLDKVWADKDTLKLVSNFLKENIQSSNKMDPFGVEASFFPYLLTEWFGHQLSIKIIKSIKQNKNNASVLFFILKKNY